MVFLFPLALLLALFIVSDWAIVNVTQAPAASSTAMTVEAVGHQWYWEFRYPGTKAVTADELHIPVDTRINLVATTADVIHSFWVPALNRKVDTIPGQQNRILLYADKVGAYRGQCAEFCGLQHAAMVNWVEVLPPAQYDAWVRRRRTDAAAVGHDVFEGVCAKCHGLSGQGDIGPSIAQSPVLGDQKAMTLLLREGRGRMPAVGKTWSDAQLKATLDYLTKRFSSGGGSGG